jgi:hypothetical protein
MTFFLAATPHKVLSQDELIVRAVQDVLSLVNVVGFAQSKTFQKVSSSAINDSNQF